MEQTWDNQKNVFDRMFKKGHFKYLILDLIEKKPYYGYEIMRALEQRFQGVYTPSAGAIYPTLKSLENSGYITHSLEDGKKVYTITENGRVFYFERKKVMDEIKEQVKGLLNSDIHVELHRAFFEIARLWKSLGYHQARHLEKDKVQSIRDVLQKAISDIETILKQ